MKNQENKGATVRPSAWMGDLVNRNPDITMECLIIPGTHDSAAYTLTPLAGAQKNYLNRAAQAPLIGRIVRSIGAISAVTQKLTIKEQLQAGVRSLDLRILYSAEPRPGHFSLGHNLTCITLNTCFADIDAFLHENPSEIIIVNIKPDWDNKDTLTPDKQTALNILLINTFKQRLWQPTNQDNLLKIPLSRLQGKIILLTKELPTNPSEGIFSKGDLILDKWLNQISVENCLSEGKQFFEENKHNTQHLLEIDSAPTPSVNKTTALILYKILSTIKLYQLSCFVIKKLSLNKKNSVSQFLIDAKETTIEKNGKKIREQLISDVIPYLDRGGVIFPSDFFDLAITDLFLNACLDKAETLYAKSATHLNEASIVNKKPDPDIRYRQSVLNQISIEQRPFFEEKKASFETVKIDKMKIQ